MQVVIFLATIAIVAVAGETLDAASKTLRTTVGEDSKMAAGLVETHRAARALSAKSTNTANVHVEKGWAVKSTHLSSTCNGAPVEYELFKMGVCEAVPLLTPTDENGDEEPPIELMTDYTPDMGDKTFSNRQCKVDVNQNPQFQMLDYSYSHSSCATPLNNDEWEPAPEEEGALCNANPNGYQEATKWFCTADDELINAISGISTATFKGTTCDSNSEIVKMSIKPANTCMPDTVTGADESFTYTSCMKDAAGGTELTVGYSMYDGKECAGEPKNTGFVQMDAECISDGDGTMNGLVCHNFN